MIVWTTFTFTLNLEKKSILLIVDYLFVQIYVIAVLELILFK